MSETHFHWRNHLGHKSRNFWLSFNLCVKCFKLKIILTVILFWKFLNNIFYLTFSFYFQRKVKCNTYSVSVWLYHKQLGFFFSIQGLKHYFSQHITDLKLFVNFLPFIYFIVFFVCFQRLYHVKETHSIFVTGLEFLPMSEATRAIVGSQDFSMLSVSADNTIKIHHMPERSRYLYCHCKWSIAMSSH